MDKHGAVLAVHAHFARFNFLGHTAIASTLALTTPVLHFVPRSASCLGVDVHLAVLDGVAGGRCGEVTQTTLDHGTRGAIMRRNGALWKRSFVQFWSSYEQDKYID